MSFGASLATARLTFITVGRDYETARDEWVKRLSVRYAQDFGPLADRLELAAQDSRRVMLADGTMTRLPVADVRLTLLFLGVDPVNERLVPIQAYI